MGQLLPRIRAFLLNSKFARGVLVLTGGAALGQLLVVVTSPLLTRIYTPDDFGVLAVYSSILGILTTLAAFRYELALPLPEDDDEALNLLALCLCLTVALAGVVAVCVYGFGDSLASLLQAPTLRPYLWLIPIGLLGAGFYQTFNYWGVRQKAFSEIARTKVSQSVGLVVAQVGLGLLQVKPLGLLIGQVVGQTSGTLTLAKLTDTSDWRSRVSFSGMLSGLKRFRKFPFFAAPTSVMNAVGSNAPSLLLTGLYSVEVAGYYLLANRIVNLPLIMIGSSISTTFHSEASANRKDPQKLKRLFWNLTKTLSAIAVVVAIVVALLAESLFTLVFGQAWTEAGAYASALAAMLAARFVVNPLSVTLSVVEKQELSVIVQGLILIGSLASLALAHRFGLTPLNAMYAFSLTMFAVYVVIFFILKYALESFVAHGS